MNIPIGLSYAQADCWDLVCLVYRDDLQLELGSRWNQVLGIKSGDWTEVDDFKRYDILLFSDGPFNKHVGIVIDPIKGLFIHTLRDTGVVFGNYRSTQWKDRFKKTYRYRSLISGAE